MGIHSDPTMGQGDEAFEYERNDYSAGSCQWYIKPPPDSLLSKLSDFDKVVLIVWAILLAGLFVCCILGILDKNSFLGKVLTGVMILTLPFIGTIIER